MSALNETEKVNQVHYLEMALRNVLGFFPTYMRPPYTACDDACQVVLKRMGYHISKYGDLDIDGALLTWSLQSIRMRSIMVRLSCKNHDDKTLRSTQIGRWMM